jgi:glycosyltransferase involved in cell wall biosynthesis
VDRSRIAIVIPAYNETATIGAVVRGVSRYGIPIVVDDASRDGTGQAAAAAGAVLVRHESNGGYDAALNAGFRRADEMNVDYVVTIDADGQHDSASIELLLRELRGGADVVTGIRPKKARLAERLFGALMRARYGIRDPLCGLKGYRLSVYREQGHFDSRGSIGTELLLFALRRGRQVAQVNIPVRERRDAPRFGSALRGNLKILRAIFNAITA